MLANGIKESQTIYIAFEFLCIYIKAFSKISLDFFFAFFASLLFPRIWPPYRLCFPVMLFSTLSFFCLCQLTLVLRVNGLSLHKYLLNKWNVLYIEIIIIWNDRSIRRYNLIKRYSRELKAIEAGDFPNKYPINNERWNISPPRIIHASINPRISERNSQLRFSLYEIKKKRRDGYSRPRHL